MTSARVVDDAPLVPTSSQTVGPFVEIGCKYLVTGRIAAPTSGEVDVTVRGRVLDGDGEIVPDYMLEIWQTVAPAVILSPSALIPSPSAVILSPPSVILSEAKDRSPATAVAFARVMPLADGSFAFTPHTTPRTRPLGAASRDARIHARTPQACIHAHVFPGRSRNATDPVLALVSADRRATLVAGQRVASRWLTRARVEHRAPRRRRNGVFRVVNGTRSMDAVFGLASRIEGILAFEAALARVSRGKV